MKKIEEIKKENTLSGLMEKLQDLPMLPAVVAQLMAFSPNDEEFFEKVLELANEDPPFSVRLLQLANSASQAPVSPITTLPHAIQGLVRNGLWDLYFQWQYCVYLFHLIKDNVISGFMPFKLL